MSWRVVITSNAERQLRRLPRKEFEKISALIDKLATNPFLGDIVKLKGTDNHWRRRVGNYRIRFQLSLKERVVFVYDIERRTSKTY